MIRNIFAFRNLNNLMSSKMRLDLSIKNLFNYFVNVFHKRCEFRILELILLLMLSFDYHLFIIFLL